MRVSLLNLDRSPERLKAFYAANGHLTDVCRVSAVDGASMSREDLRASKVLDESLETYTSGAIGCAFSHILQWKSAVQSGSAVTIAEDDAIFHHDFEALAAKVISTLPADWDIIQWGWNFDSILAFELLPGVSPCVGIFDQAALRDQVERYQGLTLNPMAYKLQRSFGTVCQTVSPAGASKLISHCLPLRRMETYYPLLNRTIPNTGIDNMMNELYPRINAYVCVPPLVITRNEHQLSTVQGVLA